MNIGLFPAFTIYEDECKSFLMGLIVLITDALEQALKSANYLSSNSSSKLFGYSSFCVFQIKFQIRLPISI